MHVCAKKDKRTSKIQGLEILFVWPERVKSRSNWHNRFYWPIISCIILTTCRSSRPTCMLIIVTHINTVHALYKRKHTMNIMRKKLRDVFCNSKYALFLSDLKGNRRTPGWLRNWSAMWDYCQGYSLSWAPWLVIKVFLLYLLYSILLLCYSKMILRNKWINGVANQFTGCVFFIKTVLLNLYSIL